MATTIKLYPFADGTINHTKSSTNSSGYSLINETTNSTTGYLEHTFSTSSTNKVSSFTNLSPASNVSISNKIRINSIDNVFYYITTETSNANLQNINLYGTVKIGNLTFNSSSFTSTSAVTRSSQTLNISNGTVNLIYESFSAANISFEINSTGQYSSSGGKSQSASLMIYNANITVTYDNVFDCKAEVISGVGIASATPTAQEVVDGDTCTFTATLQQNWKFVGWYTSSDFSGTPVSTNRTYTRTITANTTLYPKAEPAHHINIYGDTTKFTYTCSAPDNVEYAGDIVTITITPSNSIYKYSGIYEADVNGNKLSTHITNDNPYTFTMPANDVYLYVEIGKEIRIHVNCLNCSLASGTSPIITSSGKTETIRITYDSTTSDWSGIYQDSGYTVRLSSTQQYTFVVPENDVYLYAKAIAQQQIYVKENGVWQTYSKVYVKENGVWVQKDDYEGIFDTAKNYKRITL